MLKLYYPKAHYDSTYRAHVFPLLKPFLKSKEFTDQQRVALYGVSEHDFCFVDEIEQATLVILPMSWDYYLRTKQIAKAKQLIKLSAKQNKKVLLVTVGDYGAVLPKYQNVEVLRTSGESLKLDKNNYGIPVFIEDPMQRIYSKNDISTNYTKQPIIGFCGQTNTSVTNAIKETIKVILKNITYYLGANTNAPQKIQSTTYNRSKALAVIKTSKKLTANIIERKQYRAGASDKADRKKTELEFYDNIVGSNYTICIRGAGNFSVRLYETLAMGRIPVFINTNCLLPLAKDIEWKKHVVWVEFNELHKLEDKILSFHNKLTEEQFKQLQMSNRRLWEEKLNLKGFFKTHIKTSTT